MIPLRKFLWPNEYRYYDSPEGKDCFQKLFYVEKYSAIYGLIISGADVLLVSHPFGYPATLARMASITLPIMGMSAAFVCTTCIATNLRKKDDKVNYMLGGAAAGSIIGVWLKRLKWGVHGALFCAGIAAIKKELKEQGWAFKNNTEDSIFMLRETTTKKDRFYILRDPIEYRDNV